MSTQKLTITQVAEVVNKNEPDPEIRSRIMEGIKLAVQPDDGKEKEPAVKKQFVVLVSDPEGRMPKCDLVAWVLQIPENESVATTEDRLIAAGYRFNGTRKGQLFPVKTIGEAIENLPSYFFKEQDVWVKTKTPVLVLRTSNAIPRETDMREVPVVGVAAA